MSYFSMYALVTRTSYFQNRMYDFIVCNFVCLEGRRARTAGDPTRSIFTIRVSVAEARHAVKMLVQICLELR